MKEEALDSDEPQIAMRETDGAINADLTVGTDVTGAIPLLSNEALSFRGITFMGAGFILPANHAAVFKSYGEPYDQVIRSYISGRDLVSTKRNVFAIDLFGWNIDEVRKKLPRIYQHLLETVKPVRDVDNRLSYREEWWIFAEPRSEFREAIKGLPRFIATSQTARHRVLQFLDKSWLPDQTLVLIAASDGFTLGVLSSRIHVVWAFALGGWLGVGNDHRYSNSRTFACFPFPIVSGRLRAAIDICGEELDVLRKRVQGEHPDLTLTQIYNVLEKLRRGEPLDAADEAIKDKGLVLIVKELHDKLDALVAEAYGWPADLSDEDILALLAALNAERAAEEKRGLVRWLRPDYQRARAGLTGREAAPAADQIEAPLVAAAAKEQKPSFPVGEVERTAAVFAALAEARGVLDAASIARGFRQGARVEPAVARILASLARLGHAHTTDSETFALRRRA